MTSLVGRVTALFVAAVLAPAFPVAAQLSGTYTIDPNGTGARNYTNFASAAYALAKSGVSGPVTLKIAPGTYAEAWFLAPVPGASKTNKIVFTSPTPLAAKLTEARGTRYVPIITIPPYAVPLKWIVFEGIEFFRATSSAVYSTAITGSADDMEIRNCLFTSARIVVKGARWEIHHNLVNCDTPVYLPCSFLDVDGFNIHHNEFRLQGQRGMELTTRSGASGQTRFWNNLISGWVTDRDSAGMDFDGAREVIIEHNTIVMNHGVKWEAPCLRIGGVFARENQMRNNILVNLGNGVAAQFASAAAYHNIAHNNIYWVPNNPYLISLLRSGSGSVAKQWSSLASWQSSSGVDKDSLQVDPKIKASGASPPDLHVAFGSPAVNKAGNTSAFILDDFTGEPRYKPATIGGYEGFHAITFTTFGKGCAGTGGYLPKIGSAGGHFMGSRDFRVTLTKALGGFNVRAILAIGGSNSTWGTISLPLALGGGCSLRVSMDILVVLPVGGSAGGGNGTTGFNIPIPNDPRLLGSMVHFQWAVADPAAQGIGLAFSDGATVKL